MLKNLSKANELIQKYGTLEEFKVSVLEACKQKLITEDEALKGIKKYEEELLNAIKDDENLNSKKVVNIEDFRKIQENKKREKIINKLLEHAKNLKW
jgi:hypothetical protein